MKTNEVAGDGTATAMVEWKRKEVRDRYAIAVDILGGFLRRPSAICPHLWISLPESWRPDQFVFEARGRGVLISPADAFAVTRRSASAFRVCIGAVARRDQLEAGLRTLRGLLSGPPNTGFDVI